MPMRKHTISTFIEVSEQLCVDCYWLLITHKGDRFCMIAEDKDMDFSTVHSCNAKTSREEALRNFGRVKTEKEIKETLTEDI